jgi:hypothetical protein
MPKEPGAHSDHWGQREDTVPSLRLNRDDLEIHEVQQVHFTTTAHNVIQHAPRAG